MWKVQIYSLLLALTCIVGSKGYSQFSGENPAGDQGEQAPTDTVLSKSFLVKDIVISGNKKTRPYIIERELLFRRGDSVNLTDLVKKFERSKELLLNTALFHEVIISLQKFEGHDIYVAIDVKERWYILFQTG